MMTNDNVTKVTKDAAKETKGIERNMSVSEYYDNSGLDNTLSADALDMYASELRSINQTMNSLKSNADKNTLLSRKRVLNNYIIAGIKNYAIKLAIESAQEVIDCSLKRDKAGNTFYSVEFEDLMSKIFCVILEQAPKYDKKIGQPTTFFKNHIRGAISDTLMKVMNKRSNYYHKQVKLIKQAQAALRNKGFSEAEVNDPALIVKENPTLTRKQIENALSMDNMSFWDTLPDRESTEHASFDTPEKAMLKSESDNRVEALLGTLSPAERLIFALNSGIEDGRTYTYKEISIIPDVIHILCEEHPDIKVKKGKIRIKNLEVETDYIDDFVIKSLLDKIQAQLRVAYCDFKDGAYKIGRAHV